MKSARLKFDFGHIHYLHNEIKDRQTILFVHGNASSAESFSEIADLCDAQFNVIAMDFPGHGLSEHIDVEKYGYFYSMAGLKEVLIEFIDRLSLKKMVIAGNSLGANIIVQALPQLPNVAGVILMASIHALSKEDFFSNVLSTAPRDLSLKNELERQEIQALAKAFIDPSRFDKSCFDQMLKDITLSDGNFREQIVLHMRSQTWLDELAMLSDCTLPMLYIGGKRDAFIKADYYEKVRRTQSAISMSLLDCVGHVPHLEDPKSCYAALSNFINEKI